jgi:hypothetical protein
VRYCESSDRYDATNRTGKYRGAWQMDEHFWKTYHRLAFGYEPTMPVDKAPPEVQDAVAYTGFLHRGWQPWTCAKIVGLR